MQTLSVSRFGLAFGGALAILNLICVLIIDISGPKALASFVKIVFHGLDMSSIVAPRVGFWMAVASITCLFVLGGILGMLIAGIYNATVSKKA